LKGKRIAVQGLGNVGYHLCEYLSKEGVQLIVSDIDAAKVKKAVDQFSAKSVSPDEISSVACDIFAPCALGAGVNDQTISKFKCEVIAGGANNVLAEDRHGMALKELGILYAPDYVINAGGLMNVFVELEGYSQDRALQHTFKIYQNLKEVFQIAKKENIPNHKAADRLAEARMGTIGRLKQKHTGKAQRLFNNLKIEGR
jgi:leucine dehydrogenase